MKKLIAMFMMIIMLLSTTINCFAFENGVSNTGDNSTFLIIVLGAIMLVAIIAIIIMSVIKK